jgi:hypothetical protein
MSPRPQEQFEDSVSDELLLPTSATNTVLPIPQPVSADPADIAACPYSECPYQAGVDDTAGYPDVGTPSAAATCTNSSSGCLDATGPDATKPVVITSTGSANTLSYPLGAGDISKIVDALLSPLSPLLTGLTDDEKYVLLHKSVLKLSKDKTFTNKDDLDKIVKENIVKPIVDSIVKAALNNSTILPDYVCAQTCDR